ncbi:MAG: hypothetical protein MK101_00715 [Phycisphaerales bacterium]|nr:hypothetical protein [Phycisphaerales bacterium]
MTTHTLNQAELEELAVLDAWGLLEGEELAQFEAAFAALDAPARAQLRSIQTACTAQDASAPDLAAPPAHLRALVLQRIQAFKDLEHLNRHDSASELSATPTPLGGPSLFGSAALWRMAALILLAVSITLVVMHRETASQYDRLLDEHTLVAALGTMQADMTPDEQAAFVAMLRRPDVRHAYLAADDGPGLVRIAIDETTGETFVLAFDLSGRATPCALELETADGEVIQLAAIRTDRPIDGRHLIIDMAQLDGATFRLRDGNNTVIGSVVA